MTTRPVIVLGAGIAGLGAADRLRRSEVDYLLIEKQDGPGGLVRTDRIGEFLFDRAGHFIHVRSHEFRQRIEKTAIRFQELERRSAILMDGHVIPYPLQFNLWAAPKSFADQVERDLEELPLTPDLEISFEDILRQLWGPTLTDRFFRPFHEKMWHRSLYELPGDWAAEFAPRRDIDLMRIGLKEPIAGYGYNATFYYPASGRIGELAETIAEPHLERMLLETQVTGIDLLSRVVLLADGRQLPFSALISTIPLPHVLAMLNWPVDGNLFRHSNMINLRVGFRGKMRRDEHWYYVPDPDVSFFRVGFPCNVADKITPPDCCGVSLEYGIGTQRRLETSPHELAVQALRYLASHNIIEWTTIEVVDAHLIAPAYVAHRTDVTPQLQHIATELACHAIYLAGRYGRWDYLSVDQAYCSGVRAAEQMMRPPFAPLSASDRRARAK